MSLNNSEYELFKKLKKVPIDQLLSILASEVGMGLEYRQGRWKPTLECWKIIRRHGWTSKEFMETPPVQYEINR